MLRPWKRFVLVLISTFAGLLGATLLFVVVMNPYGNLPVRIAGPHVITDTNQRFQHPSIIRSGKFDSAVFGTSSSALLDPGQLEQVFGGHWANLAMDDARAWEQVQLVKFFLRNVPRPATLLFGLDLVWCEADADLKRITRRGFPEWLYDAEPLNDWGYLANSKTFEIALRQALTRLGWQEPRVPPNGYNVFTPPENSYDAKKAEQHIWQGQSKQAFFNRSSASNITAEDRGQWAFPALSWLANLADSVPAGTRAIFVWLPQHITVYAPQGSLEYERQIACKSRAADIVTSRGFPSIDFRIASAITTNDRNYWDRVHYRLPIAHMIVAGIQQALRDRSDSPQGLWRYAKPKPKD